jgi:DNA-binding MarR family transcriptional regulator
MDPTKLQPTGETLQFMQRMWDFVHALDVRSKRMMKSLGVTGPQRLVIRIVGQKPGQTASDIASMLGKHPSTLTGVLARLEARQLILREVDPADRRRARFKLTAGGKKINSLNKGTVEAATRRALGRVSPIAVDTTLDLVGKLVEELVRDE